MMLSLIVVAIAVLNSLEGHSTYNFDNTVHVDVGPCGAGCDDTTVPGGVVETNIGPLQSSSQFITNKPLSLQLQLNLHKQYYALCIYPSICSCAGSNS